MFKKLSGMLAAITLIAAVSAGGAIPAEGAEKSGAGPSIGPVSLTILFANDTHSTLFPFGPHKEYGGIARMATLIETLKRSRPNVLTLHAGDAFVGSFEFNKYLGYPELKIMENLYNAMALGNHEFDLGLDALAGVLSGQIAGGAPIEMPILCANLDTSGRPDLAALLQPSIVRTVGGLKVGLFAVVNNDPQNYSTEIAALLRDPYEAAGEAALDLRQSQNCDLVICLSHLGVAADQMGLSQIPGIDVIVGGHSHTRLNKPIEAGGKVIVQAGEFGMDLGELSLHVDARTGQISIEGYKLHAVDKRIPEASEILGTLDVLREGLVSDPRFGPVFSKDVAKAEFDLEKFWDVESPDRDTPLGNLITDALRKGVRAAGFPADLALEANGYIAAKIYKGKVVGNDILRAVPYGYDPDSGLGFKIHSVLLAGAQILAGLEYSLSYVEYTDELSLQASHLTFQYDSRRPASGSIGEISRLNPESVRIGPDPIDPNGLYWVVLNEQLLGMLKSKGLAPFAEVATGLFEYNLVVDYMKELNKLEPVVQGRIIDIAAGPGFGRSRR